MSPNSVCYCFTTFFVLWRYETDGTVESPDEILNFLSMCVYIFKKYMFVLLSLCKLILVM